MELTEQQNNNAAQLFIQMFPHMTFAKAKTTFDKIQKPVQNTIWEKVEKNKENKILSAALHLTLLPQKEHQSFILAETSQPSETLQEKLNKETILELLVRKVEIDEQCQDKDYLDITILCRGSYDFHGGYWNSNKTIRLTKQELFSTTENHIRMAQNVQKKHAQQQIATKSELMMLNELDLDLFKKLMCSGVTLLYREGKLPISKKISVMTNDALHVCKTVLPYVLLPLLYTRLFIQPTWSTITGSQDPLLLEQNSNFEAANKVIDNLKKLNINGSEHLIKHIINEVPFTYSWSDWGNLVKPLLPKALMYQAFMIFGDNCLFRKDFSLWWKMQYYGPAYFPSLFFAIVTAPILYYLSKEVFSEGTQNGLIGVTFTVVGTALIKNRIDSYKWKEHSVDFTEGESITQFLNNPEFQIKENFNE
jgi:hypothetical protein